MDLDYQHPQCTSIRGLIVVFIEWYLVYFGAWVRGAGMDLDCFGVGFTDLRPNVWQMDRGSRAAKL